MKILLIEDDSHLAAQLSDSLWQNDFVPERVSSAEDAMLWPEPESLSCIVLDLTLPNMDGQDFIGHWRAAGNQTPILVLSARSRWEQKVSCLNAGADDYLVKPVQIQELVARLHSLIRRTRKRPVTNWLECGDIRLHAERKIVEVGAKSVMLTPTEFRLLHILMQNTETPVSQERMLSTLYSLEDECSINTIDVNILRLRRKIGKEKIKNIRGVGYKIAG